MWMLVPLAISNDYLLIGMWLKGLPTFFHYSGWLMSIPSALILLGIRYSIRIDGGVL
jgi:hypothetical protein